MRQHKYRVEERTHHVNRCRKWITAGKSIRSYGLTYGINPRTLHGWMNRYNNLPLTKEKNESQPLVKVKRTRGVKPEQTVETSSLRVVVGSLAIELPAGNSDQDLKRLLITLKEVI